MQLPPDLNAREYAHLATGEFESPEGVLRAALDALERRQRSLERLRDMLRQADVDIAAGRVGLFGVEAALQAVQKRIELAGQWRPRHAKSSTHRSILS